jgi:putative peptide zinc metalloprotease protein
VGDACPPLATDVALVGPMPDTGFEQQPWLVRRGARFLQVSELMYRLLERCDGRSGPEEIADALTRATQWSVTADNVIYLIREKLVPLGLLAESSDVRSTTELPAAEHPSIPAPPRRSALAIHARHVLLGPRAINALGGALRFMFLPPVLVAVLVTAMVAQGWLFFAHGLTGGIGDVLNRPAAFLVLVGAVVLAALVHELGHAAGLIYGGGQPRAMGFGFYLIFPAFYTDVTDAYRLPRRARVRTDLGGPYFHLVFTVLVVAAYLLARQEYLLILVLLIDVEILRQFIPFLRLDGYWLLADLAGVPDFFSQAGPFLRRATRGRVSGERIPPLRRSVRVTFFVFLVVTFVVLPTLLVMALLKLPHVGELAWLALLREGAQLRQAWEAGLVVGSAAVVITMVVLMLQIAGMGVFLYLVAARPILRAWTWTAGKPVPVRSMLRGCLAVAVGGVVVVLGSLYPWRNVGATGGGNIGGLSLQAGRVALACGLLLMAGVAVILTAKVATLRRLVTTVALMAGLAGALLAARDVMRTRGVIDQAIRQSIRHTTGREATPGQVDEVRNLAAGLGISASPGFGAFVVMGGGLVAAGGAAVLLVRRPPRQGRGSESATLKLS